MIAIFFALFAQAVPFPEFIAKSLHLSPEAVQRSLASIDEKHFATIELKFSTEDKCKTNYSCPGTWTVQPAELSIKPSPFDERLFGSGNPTYLLIVAVDRHRRPLWFATINDFRFVEVPPSRDGKIGWSITSALQASDTFDIPTDIGARALQIYSPANCGDKTCLNFNGSAPL